MAKDKHYFPEIDFTKGILIILMVIFHLRYIGVFSNQFENLTKMAYSFHMPGFLLLSGFLTNFTKPIKDFISDIFKKLFVPYLVFELGYLVLLFIAGKFGIETANSMTGISIVALCDKLFIHPIGTYWYLYTLIISNLVFYFSMNIFLKSDNWLNYTIFATIILFLITLFTGIELQNIIFYVFGIVLRNFQQNYSQAIKPTLFSIIPFLAVLYFSMPELSRFSISGIIITFLALSICAALFIKLKLSERNFISLLGKNSLAIVIFSPFFTVLCKMFQKYMLFDKSGILFILLATIITLIGSLFMFYLFDKIKISRFIFGTAKTFKR